MSLLPRAALLVAHLAFLPALGAAQDAPTAASMGDPTRGEAAFGRQCVACHVIADASGQVQAGRSGRTGPNLYGVMGRIPGTVPDFDYGESLLAYGATGAVWEEANLVTYLLDPTPFLREVLQDPTARGKMSYKVRNEEDARDLQAFLATFSPGPPAPADAAPAEGAATEAPASN